MLKELNIEFNHLSIHFLDGSTRKPDFLAINPNGRVPVLVDHGFILFESMAINLYLSKKYSGSLSPKNLIEDCLATQWSFWVVNEVERPLLFASANRKLFAKEGRNEEQATMAINKLDRPFKVLDAHLASRDYLLGESFTVADLNVATVMDLAPQCSISLEDWPRLKAWHERCLARPAAQDWKDVSFSIPRPNSELGLLKMFV